MLLRKDNRALVVDIKPGVVEARLREMHCQKVFMTNPDMLQRFVLLGHCLLVCDMPNGKLAIGFLKPKKNETLH